MSTKWLENINKWKNASKKWERGVEKWKVNEDGETSDKWFGGEVTNESDTSWLISGNSNSNEGDFNWLPPNTNSDDMKWVKDKLDGDVDAVWPAGKALKNKSTGEIVTSGAFKLRDHRNTNIIKKNNEYIIYDFSIYYPDDALPPGWELPQKYKQ